MIKTMNKEKLINDSDSSNNKLNKEEVAVINQWRINLSVTMVVINNYNDILYTIKDASNMYEYIL